MNKAIFWDFDGTLVHGTGYLVKNILYDALTKLGYDIDIEKVRYHLSHKSKGYTWDTPEISYTDDIGQKWWDKLFGHFDLLYENYNVSKEDRERANSYFKSRILDSKHYTLFDDAVNVLSKCKELGYKNYILSNNYPELPLVIKDMGLDEYFSDYIVSANVGYDKPRIEIFQYALKLADFPDDCYMIGDNPVADIQGGKSAGMKTVLVHNQNTDVSDADYICENLSEILDKIEL